VAAQILAAPSFMADPALLKCAPTAVTAGGQILQALPISVAVIAYATSPAL